jgi:hypothetical protein
MTTASIALITKTRPDLPAIVGVIDRAREGDPDALVYVFDNVFYDVYHHVLLTTRNRRDAERITRRALDRSPSMLRDGRYSSVEGLRAGLLKQAERQLRGRTRIGVTADGTAALQALLRHVVLITSAAAAATGALVLVM